MLEEHKKIIKNSIKDSLDVRDEFFNFEITSNLQLFLSQLDLFRVVSSLVIGIIGIGYFYNDSLNKDFLIISLLFAVATLLISISFAREFVDLQINQNRIAREGVRIKTQESINKAIEALKNDDSSIYFNYAEEQLKQINLEPKLNYMGEIIVFSFYSSLGFLGFSFLSRLYNFNFISLQTGVLLILIYFLSFTDWAVFFSEILSKSVGDMFKKTKKNK